MSQGPYVVQFVQAQVWRLRAMLMLCIPFGALSILIAPQISNPMIGLAGLFAGVSLVVLGIVFLAGSVGWGRRPALVADPDGLTVGLAYGHSLRFSWHELESVYVDISPTRKAGDFRIVILPKDIAVLRERWGPLWGWLTRVFPGPHLWVETKMLAKAWGEIEEEIKPYVSTDGPAGGTNLSRLKGAIGAEVTRRVTMDGKLKTLQDYQQEFKRSPLGWWGDTEYSVTPADSQIHFRDDGTGLSSTGVAMMFGGGDDFQWRETPEDFVVECRGTYEGAEWQKVAYRFEMVEGEIEIDFRFIFDDDEDVVDADEAEEDVDEDRDRWMGGFWCIGGGMHFLG